MKIHKLTKIVLLVLLTGLGSCADVAEMDDFKDFTADGEINYSEKVDSLKIFSGKNRAKIQGIVDADPKITEFRVYWNSKKDSVVVPITRSIGIDTLEVVISDLPENIYNFEIRTFDSQGNSSIPVSATGEVYGERYHATLFNRPHTGNLSEEGLKVDYAGMDLTSGVIGTELVYTNNLDEMVVEFTEIASSTVIIEDYKLGSQYKYRTLFLPEETALDTFYTEYSDNFTPILVPQLKNNSVPFKTDGTVGRFRVLKDWISNDVVVNFDHSGDSYGGGVGVGYDDNYSNIFAIQIGYGNVPNTLENAKIYQTLRSGASDFRLTVKMRGEGTDLSLTEERYAYAVVLKGNSELPDVDAILDNSSSNVLAVKRITNRGGQSASGDDFYNLDFTVEEAGEITVGLVYKSSGENRYLRFLEWNIAKQN
ncbi:DUF4998 domain-containing protein [Leeuwenhoekiella sp. NPDC079379]|uniref:DUF4998 domain-containing protein n=1 Tax=Leeuwenhoekiella sp. NPDC079379 TaxID=3364122 RepID=UPI0037CB28A4